MIISKIDPDLNISYYINDTIQNSSRYYGTGSFIDTFKNLTNKLSILNANIRGMRTNLDDFKVFQKNLNYTFPITYNRRAFTNYKKADWTQFTEDTESAFTQTTIPTNIHTANIIFTNIILMADKHNIPKGKMRSNYMLLVEDIVCKITQRNNIKRATTCDPAHKLLNEEITSNIQKHKQNIWKEQLDAHWDHRHNTHILWKTIHGLSSRAPPHTLNISITFNNKIATTHKHIANCFTTCEWYTWKCL